MRVDYDERKARRSQRNAKLLALEARLLRAKKRINTSEAYDVRDLAQRYGLLEWSARELEAGLLFLSEQGETAKLRWVRALEDREREAAAADRPNGLASVDTIWDADIGKASE